MYILLQQFSVRLLQSSTAANADLYHFYHDRCAPVGNTCRGGHGRSPQYYSDDDGSAEAVVTSAAHIDNAAADEASAGLFEKIEVTRLQHRANGGARTSLLSGALAAVKSQEHSDATAASAATAAASSAQHDRY
jgi:hypothetical protein